MPGKAFFLGFLGVFATFKAYLSFSWKSEENSEYAIVSGVPSSTYVRLFFSENFPENSENSGKLFFRKSKMFRIRTATTFAKPLQKVGLSAQGIFRAFPEAFSEIFQRETPNSLNFLSFIRKHIGWCFLLSGLNLLCRLSGLVFWGKFINFDFDHLGEVEGGGGEI